MFISEKLYFSDHVRQSFFVDLNGLLRSKASNVCFLEFNHIEKSN